MTADVDFAGLVADFMHEIEAPPATEAVRRSQRDSRKTIIDALLAHVQVKNRELERVRAIQNTHDPKRLLRGVAPPTGTAA